MKYRILYKVNSKDGWQDGRESIEATSDEDALQKYRVFNSRAVNQMNDQYYDGFRPDRLVRVDQEEKITLIPI